MNYLVAKQQMRIGFLEDEIASYKKSMKEIFTLLYGVGGPLNDNPHQLSTEQVTLMHQISDLLKGIGE